MQGHTLALDFPRNARADELIGRLEAITREHGGRVYLAKDSLLSRESFEAMYPEAARFVSVVARVDPDSRFTSDQARRLGLKPPR
jgi:decaprenylphospho-beta-D-ribofuranose 2-oxidase